MLPLSSSVLQGFLGHFLGSRMHTDRNETFYGPQVQVLKLLEPVLEGLEVQEHDWMKLGEHFGTS